MRVVAKEEPAELHGRGEGVAITLPAERAAHLQLPSTP